MRHADFLELKLRHPKVKHRPGCTRGKRRWRFSWKWPFVHTWISQAICMCEIIEIEAVIATFDEIVPILKDAGYDCTPTTVRDMAEATRRNLLKMPPEERQRTVNKLNNALVGLGKKGVRV